MSVSDPWERDDGRRRASERAAERRPLADLADRLAEARRSGEPAPEELERLVELLAKSDIDPGERLTRALEGFARWSETPSATPREEFGDRAAGRRGPDQSPRDAARPVEPRSAPARNPIPNEFETRRADHAQGFAAPRGPERDDDRPRHGDRPARPRDDRSDEGANRSAPARPEPRAPERKAPPPIASLRAALAEISARQKALDTESDAAPRRQRREEPRRSDPASDYRASGRASATYAFASNAETSRPDAVPPAVMQELRAELDRLEKSVGDLPTRAGIDRLTREMADLAERLTAERPARLDRDSLTAIDALVSEVDRMRSDAPTPQAISRISEEVRAISARLEVLGPRSTAAIESLAKRIDDVRGELDHFPRTSAVADLASEIKALISRLDEQEAVARPTREAVIGLAGRVQALDGQIAAITEAAAARDMALDRINTTIRTELDTLPRADAVSDLGRQIDALTEGLKSRSAIGPAIKAVEGLSDKVEALDGRIAAAFASRRSEEEGWLTDAMRDGIAAIAQPEAMESLSRQIELLSERLAAERRDPSEIGIQSLASQIEGLSDRFDAVATATRSRGAAFERVEDSIRAIAEQLLDSRAPAADAPGALGEEIARLAERFERNDDRIEDLHEAFVGVAARIERSCADLGAHAVESAVAAARDVLGSEAGGGRLDSEFADALAELRGSSAQSERRAADALDAVRSTLERLLDRMENQGQADFADPVRPATFGHASASEPPHGAPGATEAARAAAQRALEEIANEPEPKPRLPHVEERPQFRAYGPLDPDFPLEPGSARPTLEDEPVSPAPQSAASFIASARRATQLGGLEAELSAEPRAEKDKRASLLTGVLSSLRKNKRPILFGVAAVLIVFTALYVASGMSGEPEEAPPPAPQSRIAPTDEPKAAALDQRPKQAPTQKLASADADDETIDPKDMMAADDPVAAPSAASPETPPATASASSASAQVDAPRAPARDLTSFAFAQAPATKSRSVDWKTAEPETTGSIAKDANGLPEGIGGPTLRGRALAGDAAAELEVADRLLEGRNVEANPAVAAKWLEKAAAQGLASAQHRLGSLYEKGRGVPRDVAAARRWYEQAAASGNVRAMHNLGVVHAEGGLGKPDYNAAMVWFRMAAERGLNDSGYNLAVLAARGLGGKRDLVEAYKWFALAAQSGDEDAAKKRDEVGKALGASLPVAKAAVETFKPKPIDPAANDPQPPAGGWDKVAARSNAAPATAVVR